MSENSGRNDPSMKEILGSIRRIINEDNAQSARAETAPGEEDILDLTEEVGTEDMHRPRLDPSFGAHENGEEPEVRREPVLGLHNPLRSAGHHEPEQPEQEKPAKTADETPAAFGEYSATGHAGDNSPDAPEEETFPASADQFATEPVEEPAEATDEMIHQDEQEADTQTPATGGDEPAPREEAYRAAAEPTVPEPPESEVAPAAGPVREIVSESTTAATATAIGELTRAMEEKTNKLKLGPGEETLSDMVREMLRPMLRDWLDENLPGIVERIVRREIQKLVDRSETDD